MSNKKITIKEMIKFGLKHITKKNLNINKSIVNKNILAKSLSTDEELPPLPVTFEVLYSFYLLL